MPDRLLHLEHGLHILQRASCAQRHDGNATGFSHGSARMVRDPVRNFSIWGRRLTCKFRWHVLTGLGVFYYITFIEYLRLTLDTNVQRDGQIDLIWPGTFSLPHLEVKHGKGERQL
jgi:hypothetical protein